MPAQMPVMSKRIGNYQYERYDLSGGGSPFDKKNEKNALARRRPQGDQNSDADSETYQVKTHTVLQRRPRPRNFIRSTDGTYFDRVLNNSEDSYEESNDDDSSYICDNCKTETDIYLCPRCKNNSAGYRKLSPSPPSRQYQRYNKQEQNDEYGTYSRRFRPKSSEKYRDLQAEDESVSEDETTPPPRRIPSRQPEKPKRSGNFGRQQKLNQKPEISDRTENGRVGHQGKQRQPQRDSKREQSRSQRGREYADLNGDDDEYDSENSLGIQNRRSALRQGNRNVEHPRNGATPRRGKPMVVERKTTTRLSRQNEEDIKIGRKKLQDDISPESWSAPSEESDDSETYERVEAQRRPSRRPNRKEHFQYEDERPKPQGRQVRPKSKLQGSPYGEAAQNDGYLCKNCQRQVARRS